MRNVESFEGVLKAAGIRLSPKMGTPTNPKGNAVLLEGETTAQCMSNGACTGNGVCG